MRSAQEQKRESFVLSESGSSQSALNLLERFTEKGAKLTRADDGALRGLANAFLYESPAILRSLEKGLEALDPEKLERLAKRLEELPYTDLYSGRAVRALATYIDSQLVEGSKASAAAATSLERKGEGSGELGRIERGSKVQPQAGLRAAVAVLQDANLPKLTSVPKLAGLPKLTTTPTGRGAANSPKIAPEVKPAPVERSKQGELLAEIAKYRGSSLATLSIEQLIDRAKGATDPMRLCIAAEIVYRFGAERVLATGLMEPLITNPNNSCKESTAQLWELIKELRKLESVR